MKTRCILAAFALVSLVGDAGADAIRTLVVSGEPVGDVGLAVFINNLAVNDRGDWLLEVDTNNPDTNADVVILKNGLVFARENQAVDPAPAAISSFDSVNINNVGNSGWNFFLRNMPISMDSGVYFNTTLVIPEGSLATAPQFSANTPYIGFFEVRINDNNQLLVVASVDDPNIPTTVDRALVRMNSDGTNQVVIAKEGDTLPGQTETVADFGTGPHNSAFTDAGAAMFTADLTGDTALDWAVYLGATLLALEGGASPVSGRNWATLSSSRVDANNVGGYVYTGTLAGDTASDTVIIRNGVKFVQEGDLLPAVGFRVTSFGTSSPVLTNDRDQVLWFADWDDPDTTRDTGIFLNDRLILQEGVTRVGAYTVGTIASGQDAYALSDNGRYVVVETGLVDGGGNTFTGAVLIELCGGDVNNDGRTDQADLGALLAAWNTCPGTAGYNAAANLATDDPCINQADLGVLLAGWNCGVE